MYNYSVLPGERRRNSRRLEELRASRSGFKTIEFPPACHFPLSKASLPKSETCHKRPHCTS
jgi:hypothetical protein